MKIVTLLACWFLLATTAVSRASDTVEHLLRNPVSQMDYGLIRMAERLTPVFSDLGSSGIVVWDRSDSMIEILVEMDASSTDSAPWEAARRAAHAVRSRLGVDPRWGRFRDGVEHSLEDLFELATSPAPSKEALAELIRVRVAVWTSPALTPHHYAGELLDDDVHLDGGPSH